MALLDDVKLALRISSASFDTEITDLISAAQSDLQLSGVTAEKAVDTTDPLIKRAIITYCKANFGWDNPDADRLQQAYNMLKSHLTLSQEYSLFTVTFSVTDGVNPLEDALVSFNDEEKYTDSAGQTVFTGVKSQQNMEYTVTLDGYKDVTGDVDVASSTTVNVTMEAV